MSRLVATKTIEYQRFSLTPGKSTRHGRDMNRRSQARSLDTEWTLRVREAAMRGAAEGLFAALADLLGANKAREIYVTIARSVRPGRGRAENSLAGYDVELQRLYMRVRGKWRRLPDGSMSIDYRVAKFLRVAKVELRSLPRAIAERLCTEDRWHLEVLTIFNGVRPEIFSSDPKRIETVERYIRGLVHRWAEVEASGGPRIVWPPWPPAADK